MRQLGILLLAIFGGGWGCLQAAPEETLLLTPLGKRLTVKATDRTAVAIQVGRLSYRKPTGESEETGDLYLIAFVNAHPLIIERASGHTPSLEIQDIDADGKREVLFFYHTGANRLVLRLYRINDDEAPSEYFTRITGDQLDSNMGSIKIVHGKIETLEQQRVSPGSAINSTETYELDGLTLKRAGTRHEIVTQE